MSSNSSRCSNYTTTPQFSGTRYSAPAVRVSTARLLLRLWGHGQAPSWRHGRHGASADGGVWRAALLLGDLVGNDLGGGMGGFDGGGFDGGFGGGGFGGGGFGF